MKTKNSPADWAAGTIEEDLAKRGCDLLRKTYGQWTERRVASSPAKRKAAGRDDWRRIVNAHILSTPRTIITRTRRAKTFARADDPAIIYLFTYLINYIYCPCPAVVKIPLKFP